MTDYTGRKEREKHSRLSYDDGIEQDRRLVRMMNERKVRGTFNLNSGLFGRKGRVAAGKKKKWII